MIFSLLQSGSSFQKFNFFGKGQKFGIAGKFNHVVLGIIGNSKSILEVNEVSKLKYMDRVVDLDGKLFKILWRKGQNVVLVIPPN